MRLAKPGGASMAIQRNEIRNREIFAAHQRGEPVGNLAKHYELSRQTVDQIIRSERHKIAVSVDDFYERMRSRDPRLRYQAKKRN
jgi:Mor family transcriptional regulator